MSEGKRVDLLRIFNRTPIRRWFYQGVHGIRQADVIVGTMPDEGGWFAYGHKVKLTHVYPDEQAAVAAAEQAMDAYARWDASDPYGGKGPTGHQAGRWVEVPPAIGPRISYGEKPGDRYER